MRRLYTAAAVVVCLALTGSMPVDFTAPIAWAGGRSTSGQDALSYSLHVGIFLDTQGRAELVNFPRGRR